MGKFRDFFLGPQLLARDHPEPLEGTNMGLWASIIPDWWSENMQTSGSFMSPSMAERVWVANRCIQLNSQQIASMPLEYHSTAPAGGFEPAWLASPDPNWYPNGISDALFAAVRSLYGWGFAILYVTSRYATGFPQTWTVIDPSVMSIDMKKGRRTYKAAETELDPFDVVQIDRNPSNALHGTSAIGAYAIQAWSLLASAELGRSVMQGGVPKAVLKSQRKLTKEQAEALQAQWVTRTSERGGAPPVLPPELDFEQLSMSPHDLLLIEGQEFTSRVIANAYGVPAFLLNLPVQGGLTYQNPAMLGEMWWRFELRPTAKRVADALTAQMLPRGNWVTFDAADTFMPLTEMAEDDDPQLSSVAGASPADQNGATLIPLRAASRNGNDLARQVTFEEGAIQVASAPVPSVIVNPPSVHVDVHPITSRKVKFSDGRTATIEEGELAHVDQ